MKRSWSPWSVSPALLLSVPLLAPPASAATPVAAPASPPPEPVILYEHSGIPATAPPGYHYERKRFLAPIIGGAVTLGLGWVASSMMGLVGSLTTLGFPDAGDTTDFRYMSVPLAGPFLTLGLQPESQRSDWFTGTALVMGGVQVVGASFLIAGLAAGKRTVLVEDERRRAFSVRPVVGSVLNGVVLQGSF